MCELREKGPLQGRVQGSKGRLGEEAVLPVHGDGPYGPRLPKETEGREDAGGRG